MADSGKKDCSSISPCFTEVQNERIDRALDLPETEDLDFKRVRNVDSVTKTACAMANARGGWIVLGLDDPTKAIGIDRVYGIEEKPECLGDIRRNLLTRIQPPLREPHVHGIREFSIKCNLRDGRVGSVVLLRIPRSSKVHSLVDGGTYVRCGPQNRQLSASEITELSLRRGTESAVDAPVDVPVELLDTAAYREYAASRRLTRPFVEQLKHLGLLRLVSGVGYRPTRAAVLLFADNPGGLLNQKCAIRVFHFVGHQIAHSEQTNLARPPVTIDGPVLNQIRQAVQVVMQELERGIQVTASGFEIRQKYPLRVVQEAITNAVIQTVSRVATKRVSKISWRCFLTRMEKGGSRNRRSSMQWILPGAPRSNTDCFPQSAESKCVRIVSLATGVV